MKLKWEIDNTSRYFRHRIITDVEGVCSEWANFDEIAVLKDQGKTYFAVTDYYNKVFPTEQILKCEKLKKQGDEDANKIEKTQRRDKKYEKIRYYC